MKVKLATYNVHRGVSFRRKPILPEMVAALDKIEFDILCLQEVWFPESFSHCGLEKLFGDSSFWSCRELKSGVDGRQANAIVSRYPILKEDFYDLSQPGRENRGLLIATLKPPDGPELHIGSLHLGLSHSERTAQMSKLETVLKAQFQSSTPLILAGDFNDWRQHFLDVKFLSSHFNEVFLTLQNSYAKTYPSFFPIMALDRIYFKGCEVTEAEILGMSPWSKLSDHIPLSATFKV